MQPLLVAAKAFLARGEAAVLVEVAEARGSAPREAGTRMLVSASRAVGTIGGGHLEWKAIENARSLLAAPRAEPQFVHYPLGPALGQCCGGAVTLRFSLLNPEQANEWPLAEKRFFLQLFGAGHVGRAIARLLAGIDCEVDWIDEREDEFPQTIDGGGGRWPDHIRKIAVDSVEAEVADAPPGAFYLVLTHQHDLDLRICEAILARGDFGYLGLIGSKTKRQRFFHRFEQRGFAQEAIDRITCPIGVPGIEGKEPEVIAIGVVAQLLGCTRNHAQPLAGPGSGRATVTVPRIAGRDRLRPISRSCSSSES
ncbi:MAG: xanthine dehydrogenase accessory protein XdhC [Burkholderiales bacterium]